MLQASLFRYRLPLSQPVAWGGHVHIAREGALMRIVDDRGHEGWGEIAPLYGFSRESLADALNYARQLIPVLHNIRDLHSTLSRPIEMDSVRSGLEQVCWQLTEGEAWRGGRSVKLQALLHGPHGQILKDAERLSSSDVEAVKIKVGQGPVEEDIRLVQELGSVLPHTLIRVDANMAWERDQAIDFATRVSDLKIDYIEEPVRDWRHLRLVANKSAVPIALDETLRNPDADGVIHYARICVVKPALMGGMMTAENYIRRALSRRRRCVVSSSWESGLGLHALLHVAAGLPRETHGLDTYRYLSEDVLKSRLHCSPTEFNLPATLPNSHDIDWQCIEPA